jgi:hypothetical protein
MSLLKLSTPGSAASIVARGFSALTAVCLVHGVGFAATLPTAPKTFDTSYAAPSGATLTVAAGGDLRAAFDKAQPGDTIVLEAGASWTGPIKLPNKTGGSGWIYVVSSQLSNLPAAGTRVSPANASSMPKILAPNSQSAIMTVANSHYFRFVGIELATVPGAKQVYQIVTIGNTDTSPATLPNNIVFDRCYFHGDTAANTRRGIEMDGAYVAVIDSYLSGFKESGIDSQAIFAFNTTGPLQIRNNYLEAATENVLFGGADSRTPELVPADIEMTNNHVFKSMSLLGTPYPMKNLLEFKAARRAVVSGNTFENNPSAAQQGFAILITPRNQNGNATWSVVSDIAFTGNTIINTGSGINILGRDGTHPSQLTERILIRDNLMGVTALNGADGRGFQFLNGGNDYTVDHNTVVNSPVVPTSDLVMAQTLPSASKVNNFVFTNNLSTQTHWGVFGAGVGEGTPALNNNFINWTFSKNVIVGAPAGAYPPGNFFPSAMTAVRFANYAGGNYTLAADSPYKNAATDGTDIGANGLPTTAAILPNPPTNVVVK